MYEFKDMIKNINCLYTQMLNGERIKKHKVVYIFDEVGCGKTVSAIIAMASIIKQNMECELQEIEQKEKKMKGYKILVITPKSICNQFSEEIIGNEKKEGKLCVDPKCVKNIAYFLGKKLTEEIEEICGMTQVIVVSNPQKANKLQQIKWDLIIIDEAHDIVCNNKKQTSIYFEDKIDKAYENYLNKINIFQNDEVIISRIKEVKKFIEGLNNKSYYAKSFIKYIAIEEYNCLMSNEKKIWGITEHHRKNGTQIFADLCNLNAEKVMFLTATPYKNEKELDFLNYALMASQIVTGGKILFNFNYLPQMDWIQNFYTGNIDTGTLSDMEDSNTSLMFKEIAQAIPFEINSNNNICGKERKVEIWKEGENKFSLQKKIMDLIEKGNQNNKNRIIIFVSNSKEGKYIFDKIFPNSKYDIEIDSNHCYYDPNKNIKCEFIMNKFFNSSKLNSYLVENSDIPDVLIVTWQVAQVGVNLPTFNYVVNYNISSIPGYLEQRYGRIDRLSSKNNPLYNVYYLDDHPKSYIYHTNLIQALCKYKKDIMDIPHNMPVKNLLICDGLNIEEIDVIGLYETLAFYVYCYLAEKPKEDEQPNNIADIESYIKNTKWAGKEITKEEYSSQYKLIVDNDIYEIEGVQEDDELNGNSEINNESNKSRIENLCETIGKIEDLNKMVQTINESKNIGEAGSIIFWNSENCCATINSSDIIIQIKKYRQ